MIPYIPPGPHCGAVCRGGAIPGLYPAIVSTGTGESLKVWNELEINKNTGKNKGYHTVGVIALFSIYRGMTRTKHCSNR